MFIGASFLILVSTFNPSTFSALQPPQPFNKSLFLIYCFTHLLIPPFTHSPLHPFTHSLIQVLVCYFFWHVCFIYADANGFLFVLCRDYDLILLTLIVFRSLIVPASFLLPFQTRQDTRRTKFSVSATENS